MRHIFVTANKSPSRPMWLGIWRRVSLYILPILAILTSAAVALLGGALLGRRHPKSQPNHLTVAVLNVGQGEASWIRTGDGKFILIGAGPPDKGSDVVASLREAGAKQIDLLFVPYASAEAVGGLPAVLNAFPVKQIVEPVGSVSGEWQQQVHSLAQARAIPPRAAGAGDWFVLGGARFDVLSPGNTPVARAPVGSNNSLVLRLTWGTTRFLWMGGLEQAGENALIDRHLSLRTDWLRVAHFGTGTASSAEFLRLAEPQYAVISVGANRENLPAPATVRRLTATGARVYRTDTQPGTLLFTSDGTRITAP